MPRGSSRQNISRPSKDPSTPCVSCSRRQRPSRRRAGNSIMRARHVIAASLVVLMAGSAAWLYVGETPVPQKPDQLVVYRPKIAGERPSAPEPSPAAPPPPGLADAPQQGQTAAQPGTDAPRMEAKRVEALISRSEQPRSRVADGRIAPAPLVRAVPVEPGEPAEPFGRDRFAGAQENAFQDGAAKRRSRPSRSTSIPPPIRSCAPRSTAMCCRSRPRCGPRS